MGTSDFSCESNNSNNNKKDLNGRFSKCFLHHQSGKQMLEKNNPEIIKVSVWSTFPSGSINACCILMHAFI